MKLMMKAAGTTPHHSSHRTGQSPLVMLWMLLTWMVEQGPLLMT
jgi:hypothetical protein